MLSDTWEGMLSDTGRAGALFHVRQSDWALAGHTQKGGALSSLHELAMRGNSVLPRESLSPDSPFSPRERSQLRWFFGSKRTTPKFRSSSCSSAVGRSSPEADVSTFSEDPTIWLTEVASILKS